MALLILFFKALFGAFLFLTYSKHKSIENTQIENTQIENTRLEINRADTEIPPSYENMERDPILVNSTEETTVVNNLEEPPDYND